MNVVFISGDHPRHTYLASQLARDGLLAGWVRETRETFLPSPPDGLAEDLRDLFMLHFGRRAEAEERFFGTTSGDLAQIGPRHDTSRDDLNGGAVHDFIAGIGPDLILSYGCHKLSPATLAHARRHAWNTHGGLSPQYRGVITHFWPSYMLEPQMTGMTLHETTEHIDGGAVVLQTGVDMVRGDGLHDLAARAVKSYSDRLPAFLRRCAGEATAIAGIPQKTPGRIWTESMWRPEHLRQIYQTYGDRVVDHVLDGQIEGRQPRLANALDPN